MSIALATAPTATSTMKPRLQIPRLTIVSSPATVSPKGFLATLVRASRRVARCLARAAGWLAGPKGRVSLALAGEGLALAGVVSRSTVSDALDAVSLAAAPFAPTRREGPRVIWG